MQRLQQVVAGGGQEPGLGRRRLFRQPTRLLQPFGAVRDAGLQPFVGLGQGLSRTPQFGDVGVAGDIAAARHRRAGGAQHAAVRLNPLMTVRNAASQRLQPPLDPGADVGRRRLSALGVQAIDFGHRQTHVDEAGRQVEQLHIARVPGDQAQVGVHHADALVDVVQRGLQQFAVELDGQRGLIQHPHHVLGCAASAGQSRGDDPPGR